MHAPWIVSLPFLTAVVTAAMLRSLDAPSQFGPLHPPQLPPGESWPMPQSCLLVSSAHSAPLPSPWSHAVTSIKRTGEAGFVVLSSGGLGQSAHTPQLPAGMFWAQEVMMPSSVMPQNREPLMTPIHAAAIFLKRKLPGGLFQSCFQSNQLPCLSWPIDQSARFWSSTHNRASPSCTCEA